MTEASLLYNAVIFDVDGVLRDSKGPRSSTLIQTLENLKGRGIKLFALTYIADQLGDFPKGLLAAVGVNEKSDCIKKLLEEHGLNAARVLYFGDDAIDERAAKDNKIRFIQVWGGCLRDDDGARMEVEQKLVRIFGIDILPEAAKRKIGKLDTTRLSDLPMPKPPATEKERFAWLRSLGRKLRLVR